MPGTIPTLHDDTTIEMEPDRTFCEVEAPDAPGGRFGGGGTATELPIRVAWQDRRPTRDVPPHRP